MRVIAGELGGHRLRPVAGNDTRPTTDRVKEAMFSILSPALVGGSVLDLFAGTGALGIESLSRGMDHCVFVDQSFRAIETIKANVSACKLTQRSEILKMDAKRALARLAEQKQTFSLVLLDPPYQLQLGQDSVRSIQSYGLHEPGTIYMIEHNSSDQMDEEIGDAKLFRRSRYGDITLSFYKEGNELI